MINYNKLINPFAFLFVLAMLTGCGGSDGGDDGGGEVKNPKAATLAFPLENSECNEGMVISDEMSRVTFEWNASEDTDSYTLVIVNLLDNSIRNINVSSTSKSENILRGVPYSWHIVSKAKGNANTASSPTWKFYNAGIAVENYAPFPAELVSPNMGGLSTTIASLKWIGSDIDNDIVSYDVFLGTATPPTSLHDNTTNTSINDISLNPDTIYYWSVTSIDAHGNKSLSPVFEFRTQ